MQYAKDELRRVKRTMEHIAKFRVVLGKAATTTLLPRDRRQQAARPCQAKTSTPPSAAAEAARVGAVWAGIGMFKLQVHGLLQQGPPAAAMAGVPWPSCRTMAEPGSEAWGCTGLRVTVVAWAQAS